jgi:hypothetical protein
MDGSGIGLSGTLSLCLIAVNVFPILEKSCPNPSINYSWFLKDSLDLEDILHRAESILSFTSMTFSWIWLTEWTIVFVDTWRSIICPFLA